MFTFTPLLGAQSVSPAVQSLLAFDGGIKVLIDVGWDESFDTQCFKELERYGGGLNIPQRRPAQDHTDQDKDRELTLAAGILQPSPYRIPVYATTPVISLGRTLIQDLYTSTPLAATVIPRASDLQSGSPTTVKLESNDASQILIPRPTNEEIAAAFASIRPLKYSQPHQPISSPFSPPLEGLTITAYSAGHTLGGTIWHLQHGSESVVYAVDWSHARENILSGAAWLGGSGTTGAEVIEQLRHPTALVCSSKGAQTNTVGGGWKSRDELLLQHITATIQRGGSVLIPCDTSARVLELAYLLEREWTRGTNPSLRTARLCLASRTCGAVMKHARSMLEWMADTVVSETEAMSRNKQNQATTKQPFDFEYLALLEKQSRLDRMLSRPGPKVFLASDSTLEWGFSQHILRYLAGSEQNTIIIPNTPITTSTTDNEHGSVNSKRALLTSLSKQQAVGGDGSSSEISIELRSCHIAGLEPTELAAYQQYLARQRQRVDAATNEKTSLETSADVVDGTSSSSSSSSDESDTEQQGKALNASATLNHAKRKVGLTDEELGINILLRRRDVHDFDVRGKKGRDRMFPFVAKRRRNDDFGDLIRPEDYIRAEEKDSLDQQDGRLPRSKQNASLGQKRRWDDKDGDNRRAMPNTGVSPTKKLKTKGSASTAVDKNHLNVLQNGDLNADSEQSDDEPEAPLVLGPSKVSLVTETLQLRMRLEAIDYAGMHDRRTLQMLMPLIKPQKLILTGGELEDTQSLAMDCSQMLALPTSPETSSKSSETVFTPRNGDTVDASVDTNAWDITISQLLYRRLIWQNLRGLGIATINGLVAVADTSNNPTETAKKRQRTNGEASESAMKRLKMDDVSEEKSSSLISQGTSKLSKPSNPFLDLLPSTYASTARSNAHSIHVGDLRLAELRRILQAQGHTAEFKGEGSLLVDNLIVVRKSGIGQIEVEGAGLSVKHARSGRWSGSFFDVKQKIYDGLAVVSAR
ncbi:MAG: hypothetical protein M1828_003225 [Chrysothrix sp. TS-e1954]|nr:MAG: hypothetical protein M1828_003225 [Chrysothrix sp. TS-e1954]